MDRFDNLQREVCDWAKATFPRSNVLTIVHHLHDEVEKELVPASEAYYATGIGAEEVREEAADALLLLLDLADRMGFDLIEATKEKLEVCKLRKWGEPDHRGVQHHIEEGTAQ